MDHFLRIGEARSTVSSLEELGAALLALSEAEVGCDIELMRDSRHYVRATNVGGLWRVDRRLGSWFSLATMTPGDFLRDQFTADEVRQIFTCFFNGEKLPFVRLGAG